MQDDLVSRGAGAVHYLTLNRPARRNALTPDLARRLADEVDRVSALDGVRAIAVTGAGGHFCVGLDLHWFTGLGATPALAELQRGLRDFQAAILAIARAPLPVIALMRGSVAGFGLDLALACDTRIAARDVTLTSAFARMGLVPDGGSTFTLPLLLGSGRALRFLLTNETVDADAALRLGLAEEIVEADQLETAAAALAERLGASATSSVRAIKRLCRADELGALEQALAAEGAAQLQALQGEDFRQRLAAFAARATSGGAR